MEQYEVNWKNYYNTLGLSPTANAQEIKTAYRRLARKYHPDWVEDATASNRMADINEAYEVLSQTDRRAKYDERFSFICDYQLTVDEALEAELNEVITRFSREERRGHWAERILVPIRTNIPNIILELFFVSMERLMDPVPLYFAWILYLLICCIVLLSVSLGAF